MLDVQPVNTIVLVYDTYTCRKSAMVIESVFYKPLVIYVYCFTLKKTDQFTQSLELGVEVTILVCQTNRNWCFYSVIKHFFQILQKEQLGNIENNDIRTTEATKVHITNFPTRKFSISVVN